MRVQLKTLTDLNRFNVYFFLYFLLLSPTAIFKSYYIMEFSTPQFIKYELWTIHVTIFDLILFCLFFLVTLNNIYKSIRINFTPIFIFLVCAIIGYIILISNGFQLQTYYDSVIVSFRILISYYIFYSIIQSQIAIHELLALVLRSAVILGIVSILFYVISSYSVLDGRLNTLGMGPNVTGEFFGIVLIIAFAQRKVSPKLSSFSMLVAITIIILSGSRRMVLAMFIIIYLYNYKSFHWSKRLLLITISTLTVLTFVTFQSSITDYLGNELGLRAFNKLSATLEKFEFTETLGQAMEVFNPEADFRSSDERYYMYNITFKLIYDYPLGLGNSNWLIQRKMLDYGKIGSHTHNFFIQNYLKYGLSLILIIYPLARLFNGFRKGTVSSKIFVLALFTQSLGFALWNIKYLILLVLFYTLNEKELLYFSQQRNPESR